MYKANALRRESTYDFECNHDPAIHSDTHMKTINALLTQTFAEPMAHNALAARQHRANAKTGWEDANVAVCASLQTPAR